MKHISRNMVKSVIFSVVFISLVVGIYFADYIILRKLDRNEGYRQYTDNENMERIKDIAGLFETNFVNWISIPYINEPFDAERSTMFDKGSYDYERWSSETGIIFPFGIISRSEDERMRHAKIRKFMNIPDWECIRSCWNNYSVSICLNDDERIVNCGTLFRLSDESEYPKLSEYIERIPNATSGEYVNIKVKDAGRDYCFRQKGDVALKLSVKEYYGFIYPTFEELDVWSMEQLLRENLDDKECIIIFTDNFVAIRNAGDKSFRGYRKTNSCIQNDL